MSTPTVTEAQHEPGEAYDGVAQVLGLADAPVPVVVRLRGAFQPIDGRFHWYGRIVANDVLAAQVSSGAAVTLETAHGVAEGKLSDIDLWGRYRISGVGRPPF
ncbi:DUF4873 domain-containing protein [Luteipulveratus mongoliensis]|uniref:DUF4873 domain-containing protein n=1 Tax=Luteipulveratus mongoliensis TaxID=571913 RepID=A0A0K1JHX5_9MICO|nr:DUF4873 domain-containing protein [Luteipulveratus mongoliensis]AKU16314.1 hypothetical protein VV02_11330 [Luteipulveratus mongoliensis]